ncbi:MAG: SRPBCC domain-containing protein [Betaproteobacteria bacterium]|nr:MAG: SRPBCC domain-containing protein [Betaproteobacteria bacterium]
MEQAAVTARPFLVLERFYPVAPEKVWRAWTDPQELKRWFGPGGNDPVSLVELDLRAGGRYRIVFGGPDGAAHEVQGVYREVVPNRKLVFTWVWPRTTPERESLVTIEFREVARGTELVFRHERFADETVRDNHRQGWSESFVKLERALLEM